MRINFRQGVVSHQSSGDVQTFLKVNSLGNIDLQTENRAVSVTVAHHDKDYLFTENLSVADAWRGPYISGQNYWLYWDFNMLTFARTFGVTTLEPVAQDAEPGNGNTPIKSFFPSSTPGVSSFTVDGYYQIASDYRVGVLNSDDIAISGQPNNNGTYTIIASNYNSMLNETTFTVQEEVNPVTSTAPSPYFGDLTLDIDYYGTPLLTEGRHWYNTENHRHYVWTGDSWREVLRVFAARFKAPALYLPQSIEHSKFTGTQIGDTASVRAGRVLFDEAANPLRRDNGTFFTTEDQFFANSSRVDGIRLEANVARAQFIESSASAYTIVAWTADGQIRRADYSDIGKTVIGVLTEDLLLNEVGGVTIQGVVTNPNWNWTGGTDAVPVGNPLWVEDGQLIPYDPHTKDNREYTPIVGISNGNNGQYFEVSGAYSILRDAMVAVKGNSANNDGNYTVVNVEFNSNTNTTRIYVDEIIVDPIVQGTMYIVVGNFPIARVPVARVLDKDSVIFEQGLGGVGERGPAGSIENMPVSSTTVLGGVYLNLPADVDEIPVVVGDNDIRLSNARTPLPHTHAADQVSFTPGFGVASLLVQGAIEELAIEKLNLAGGSMGGILKLSGAPSDPLDATTKAYVDSLVSGLVWIPPVDYVDIISDGFSTAPANPEDSDMYIVANPGGIGATWPAGWDGRLAGDVVRWDEFDQEWKYVDHISNFPAGSRFGAAVVSTATASGTFADDVIYELVNPGSAGAYDAVWAQGPEMPPVLNQAFFVKNGDSYHAFNQFVHDGTQWLKFGGSSAVTPDQTTVILGGNVLSVKQHSEGGEVDAKLWQGLEPSALDLVYAQLTHTHIASDVGFTPYMSSVTGGIAATDVQAALEEIQEEKADLQPNYADVASFPDATTYDGMTAYALDEQNHYVAQNGSWHRLAIYPIQIPYDISFYLGGNILFSNNLVGSFLSTRQIYLAEGMPGSMARAKTAPTNNVTYTIRIDDGTSQNNVGTIEFLAGSRTGTITFTPGRMLVAGQELQIITPTLLDSTIEDVTITFIGCALADHCLMAPPPVPLSVVANDMGIQSGSKAFTLGDNLTITGGTAPYSYLFEMVSGYPGVVEFGPTMNDDLNTFEPWATNTPEPYAFEIPDAASGNTYTVRVTVTDSLGATASDTADLTFFGI